mmetsp:Transcript_1287/g.2538  ORF Transcript_1287/g.2538 Transcript_1287/m.2538 type:complete len:127 (+) Transcript_1287:990-1370(+)
MLRRENELRLAPSTQQLFKAAAVKPAGWLDVVEQLQRHVAAEFGVSERVGLDAMRRAEALLPGDEEVREISLYRKFNRCVDGCVQEGDATPDAVLHRVSDGGASSLHELLGGAAGAATVVFAASYS